MVPWKLSGENASLIQTLTLLREKLVVSLLGRNRRFFSLTMISFTINSHGSMQQPHPTPHTISFPFVSLESHMMTCGVSGASDSCSR